MDATALANYVPEETLPILSGCFAFGTTLALSTLAQKLVGISTATKIVPSVIGMATVALASVASQRAAMACYEWREDPNFLADPVKRKRFFQATSPSYRSDYFHIGDHFKIPWHDLRV